MTISPYACPKCKKTIGVRENQLVCKNCLISYPLFLPEIPDFTYTHQFSESAAKHRQYFDILAENYDDAITQLLQFNEPTFRRSLIQALNLEPRSITLEVGVGTGSNIPYFFSERSDVTVFALDFSKGMIAACSRTVSTQQLKVSLSVASAEYLPFASDTFDSVLHFGFINEFDNPKQGLEEMIRVARPGGRIVVADDGIPISMQRLPWAKELIAKNPSFACKPPIHLLAQKQHSVSVKWFANIFYIMKIDKHV
jgi:ubiquinone/menaquinone biosynthesis C-methylase UbiE